MALFLGTIGYDHLVGTADADTLYGNDGDDGLFAGAGDDVVYGETGNDIIGNDFGNDLLDGGIGVDTVTFNYVNQQNMDLYPNAELGVTFDLAITSAQNLGAWGVDTIFNFENIGGSLGNDKLFGNAGANFINGDDGNDLVDGRLGNDWLAGGWGKDTLIGGAGADRLFGNGPNAGDDHVRDNFRYTKTSESGNSKTNWDQINGRFGGGSAADKIDLSAIDADPTKPGNQAFKFIGTAAFTSKVGEIRIVDTGADIKVLIDTDTDAGVEMTLLVKSVAILHGLDFVL